MSRNRGDGSSLSRTWLITFGSGHRPTSRNSGKPPVKPLSGSFQARSIWGCVGLYGLNYFSPKKGCGDRGEVFDGPPALHKGTAPANAHLEKL
jgi:hypothetical protein